MAGTANSVRECLSILNSIHSVVFATLSDDSVADEIQIRISHQVNEPAELHGAFADLDRDLVEFYSVLNGCTLFHLAEAGCSEFALYFESIENLEMSKRRFVRAIETNRQLSPEEWAQFSESELQDISRRIDNLSPVGMYGSGGDILVLDRSKEPDELGRLIVLNHEDYVAGGPPEIDLVHDTWRSASEFFRWFCNELPESLPDTFQYVADDGRPYFAKDVKFE